ncbi:MAG TPA: hypothetical protein VJQ56_08590, partial [Blastocatellia bacterium]|nr:hypothetical protein [Blastocatellia bacterium]
MNKHLCLVFERAARAVLLMMPVVLLALCAWAFNPPGSRVSRTATASLQKPKLTIVEQADSPLRISVIKKDWSVSLLTLLKKSVPQAIAKAL